MKNNIYFLIRSLLISLLFFLLLPLHSFASNPCPNSCSGHGGCDFNNITCYCENAWLGTDCSTPSCPDQNQCSGHGYCSVSERICHCGYGWSGLDCSVATSSISTPTPTPTTTTTTSCPYDCSGHGSCNSDGRCYCYEGWIASDCSVSPVEEIMQAQGDLQNVVELDIQALQKIQEGDYPSLVPIINNAIESLTNTEHGIIDDIDGLRFTVDVDLDVEIKIDRLLQSAIKNHKKASSTIDRIVNDPKVQEDEGLLSRLLNKTKRFIFNALLNNRKAQHEVLSVEKALGPPRARGQNSP